MSIQRALAAWAAGAAVNKLVRAGQLPRLAQGKHALFQGYHDRWYWMIHHGYVYHKLPGGCSLSSWGTVLLLIITEIIKLEMPFGD
jgi:hypothetical protein